MKHSHKLSDAIHILAYLELFESDDNLSSTAIAGSINTNPAVVRRLMSSLKQAGIIVTSQGVAKPKLAKESSEISLLEIYQAVEQQSLFTIDTDTNMNCSLGANIQDTLLTVYDQVQSVTNAKMQTITLADITRDLKNRL